MAAAMAAVRDPVLPNDALTMKGEDERCLLLVVLNGYPQHLFRPATLRVSDCYPDISGVNREALGIAQVKVKIKCFGQREHAPWGIDRSIRQDPIAHRLNLRQRFGRPLLVLDFRSPT